MSQLHSTTEALSTWAQAIQGILLMATMVLFVVGGAALLVYAITPEKRSNSGSSKRGAKPNLSKSRAGRSHGQRSSSGSRYRDDDCGGGFFGSSFGGDGGSCGGGDGGGGGGGGGGD